MKHIQREAFSRGELHLCTFVVDTVFTAKALFPGSDQATELSNASMTVFMISASVP